MNTIRRFFSVLSIMIFDTHTRALEQLRNFIIKDVYIRTGRFDYVFISFIVHRCCNCFNLLNQMLIYKYSL